ncbi:unnamed protein product [Umbelopsis ramanniana]
MSYRSRSRSPRRSYRDYSPDRQSYRRRGRTHSRSRSRTPSRSRSRSPYEDRRRRRDFNRGGPKLRPKSPSPTSDTGKKSKRSRRSARYSDDSDDDSALKMTRVDEEDLKNLAIRKGRVANIKNPVAVAEGNTDDHQHRVTSLLAKMVASLTKLHQTARIEFLKWMRLS